MPSDPIIAEVWRNRDAYARAHRNDLDAIVADLRKRQQEHAARVVDCRPQKRAARAAQEALKVAEPQGEYRVRNARKPLQPQRKVTP